MSRFTERAPISAKLPPRGVVQIPYKVAIESDETPFLIAPKPFQVIIRSYTATSVSLENKTDQVIPFVLFIVPRALAKAATQPLAEAARTLLDAYGPALLTRGYKRLLDGVFHALSSRR